MNKAVLALSLVMAVTVVSTIGAATVQFMTAADYRNRSDDNSTSNDTLFAALPRSTDNVTKIIIM